jgi:hypothetical protein
MVEAARQGSPIAEAGFGAGVGKTHEAVETLLPAAALVRERAA